MKILLTSIGTRGDIEPFLAIGAMLTDKGHEVYYLFPEQFKSIIPDGSCYDLLSPKFIQLLESKEGRIVMGKAGLISKISALIYLYKEGQKVNRLLMHQQQRIVDAVNPDLIVHNAKCNYPLLWHLKTKRATVLLSPVPYFMYEVKGHAHIGFNRDFGNFLNSLTYRLANYGLLKNIYDAQKSVDKSTQFSRKAIRKALFNERLVYTISPSLFKKPEYWPDHVQVLGYHNRELMSNWEPSDNLKKFLAKHNRIVLLTFGSMVNDFPDQISELLLGTLDKLGVAVIVNTAAGGIVQLEEFKSNGNFLFAEFIPYDFILDKIDAIIHHGGSGTTHAAMKHGVPTLIIPHIIDQFGWNQLIAELGAGPKGPSINTLEALSFQTLVEDLLGQTSYQNKAKVIAESMAQEHFSDQLINFILKH